MTAREKDLERFHLVSTLVQYPASSTQDVLERANEECQHDDFDPLPKISPQGIVGKLNSLSLAGLVRGWDDGVTMRWQATDTSRQRCEEFLYDLDHPRRRS